MQKLIPRTTVQKTTFKRLTTANIAFLVASIFLISCKKEDSNNIQTTTSYSSSLITIENVSEVKPILQSGTLATAPIPPGTGTEPASQVSFSFAAAKGQAISFVTMYGFSNDWFFAPANPGIRLYDADGTPRTGDVSSDIKLWDGGTRSNQTYTAANVATVTRPGGTAETPAKNITEVTGVTVSDLINASLAYDATTSVFTLTIKNISKGKTSETVFSPFVWAVSYVLGGSSLDEHPLYEEGKPAANGLADVAEKGDVKALKAYVEGKKGVFTGLSPVLVVIYNGIENPIYKVGEKDRGKGLKNIAQKGDATDLETYLKTLPGVKEVAVLKGTGTPPILEPKNNGKAGTSVSKTFDKLVSGDKIAIATMYGLSNDWFFATKEEIDATQKTDISSKIGLFNHGTSVDQLPGAGANQAAFNGTPLVEDKNIEEVKNSANPNFTLPAVTQFLKVTIN